MQLANGTVFAVILHYLKIFVLKLKNIKLYSYTEAGIVLAF